MTETTDPNIFRLTAYPPGYGPYDRWEVTIEATGALIIGGPMPIDEDAIRTACDAYRKRLAEAERAWTVTQEISNGQ